VKVASRKRQRQPGQETPLKYIRVSDTLPCRFLDGAWHLVTLKPLPGPHQYGLCRGVDILLNRPVTEITAGQARKQYGAEVYAVGKQRLTRKELRHYPIPARWWDRP
jgi:hypothetical protein